ncbi:hypothetical protein [Methyloradius palustris]|uniref:Uncharacterized protein n=1 Tax=Methyloradius palustris TaxID=2778876 RepID=A0A8D5G8I2_9PROT|nr:hypothetical protein [Methyloradius palustris]BCM25102.1 hypothetical protein ZMTM_13610 [Methyloradius palustris]
MPKIDPNLLFFGNFVDGSSRLNDLEQFREHAEGFLQRERIYFEEEAHPDIEREFLPLFAETFPPILHSSIIISTAILLEQELRGFSNALIEALNLKLKFNDLSGSIFEKFRTLVSKVANLSLDQTAVRWDDTIGLFEIRNCLVHAHGQLSEFQRASTIRAFSAKYGTPECDDSTMTVDARTSQLALEITSTFLEGIYSLAIERFPGDYGPLRKRLGAV